MTMSADTKANPEPIEMAIAAWHDYLSGRDPDGLDRLLHDDCVFYSPIVFTPQRGKDITKLYLQAAGATLPGEPSTEESRNDTDPGAVKGAFRYTKKVLSGHVAVLEFETTVQGKYVNGVDIIEVDDDSKIIEFRVMIRPLQAVNLVHAQMAAMLESMKPS